MNNGGNRIVVLVDMDCFYCQVEEQLRPELRGRPLAVVQYNQWQGGGIIAVNYLARARGVTRHMRGNEAKKHCPELELASVPCLRGKADISKYREAGKKVAHVLQEFTPLLERASVDEAYLDITESVESRIKNYAQSKSISKKILPNSYVLGYHNVDDFINDVYADSNMDLEMIEFDREHSMKLLVGAVIVSEIRAAVKDKTGYECSAGIAHNKIMAKLVCGMNKPNKQTILPKNRISDIFETLPVNKIRNLGGKFGEQVCNVLKITTMKELIKFSESELKKYFDEKNGSWLYNIARGTDNEPVTPRFSSKSIGCCKKFPGKGAIVDLNTLKHWLCELGKEIEDRLTIDFAENNRYPTQMVVSFTKEINNADIPRTRVVNMMKDDITSAVILSKTALNVVKKEITIFNEHEELEDNTNAKSLINPIKFLGISVGKFENMNDNNKSIKHFFNKSGNDNVKNSQADKNIAQTTELNIPSVQNENNPSSSSSFIMKYLKKLKPHAEGTDTENSNDGSIPEPYIDENSTSNISENSIDLEINNVKNIELESEKQTENPDRNSSFSISKFFSNHSEDTDSTDDTSNLNSAKFIDKTYCEQCEKYISKKNLATHSDYHFAKSIREEDRKVNLDKTSNIKIKPALGIPNKSRILTLFNKINDSDNCAMPKSEIHCETCHECGESIPLSDFPEHADFHEAKRLQEELNKLPNPAYKTNTINPNKRKAPLQSDHKSKKNNQCTISSFFKHK